MREVFAGHRGWDKEADVVQTWRKVEGCDRRCHAMGWYYHTCPKCREKSRKRVVRTERKSAEKVELSRGTWMTRGGVQVKEPFHVWVYAYEVEHECRSCKHRWIEWVTKQRPW